MNEILNFPIKELVKSGRPSLSEVDQVRRKFEKLLDDKEIQQFTRIGTFNEGGEGQEANNPDPDQIFAIPAMQGASLTRRLLSALARVEVHKKQEEEIGILLNPVINAGFQVKIWRLSVKAFSSISRFFFVMHTGENQLEVRLEVDYLTNPSIRGY